MPMQGAHIWVALWTPGFFQVDCTTVRRRQVTLQTANGPGEAVVLQITTHGARHIVTAMIAIVVPSVKGRQ